MLLFLAVCSFVFGLTMIIASASLHMERCSRGENISGQLGRSQGDGWVFPQLVPTLMGTRISQVLVARNSSYAYFIRHKNSDWLWRRFYCRTFGTRGHLRLGQVTAFISLSLLPEPCNLAAILTASLAPCRQIASPSLRNPALSPNS